MEKKRVEGKKNNFGKDLPMKIKTNGWQIPTNDDVLEFIEAICDNESNIYPKQKGFSGCGMFLMEIDNIFHKYGFTIKRITEKENK